MCASKLPKLSLALFALLLVPSGVRAEYLTQDYALVGPGQQSQGVAFPSWGPPGIVQIQAYDGQGAAGGGLLAGQVRLTFYASSGGAAPPPGVNVLNGFQAVGFNTDLSLSPSQIQVPTNWTVVQNPTFASSSPNYNFGTFSWGVGTVSNIQNGVSILISGLGANATLSHFLLGSQPQAGAPVTVPFESALFAGNDTTLQFGTSGASVFAGWLAADAVSGSGEPPSNTPEPSALALAGLGLAGLFGRRWATQAAGKPAG